MHTAFRLGILAILLVGVLADERSEPKKLLTYPANFQHSEESIERVRQDVGWETLFSCSGDASRCDELQIPLGDVHTCHPRNGFCFPRNCRLQHILDRFPCERHEDCSQFDMARSWDYCQYDCFNERCRLDPQNLYLSREQLFDDKQTDVRRAEATAEAEAAEAAQQAADQEAERAAKGKGKGRSAKDKANMRRQLNVLNNYLSPRIGVPKGRGPQRSDTKLEGLVSCISLREMDRCNRLKAITGRNFSCNIGGNEYYCAPHNCSQQYFVDRTPCSSDADCSHFNENGLTVRCAQEIGMCRFQPVVAYDAVTCSDADTENCDVLSQFLKVNYVCSNNVCVQRGGAGGKGKSKQK